MNITNGLGALRAVPAPWVFCVFLTLLPWLTARVLPAAVRLLGHCMVALATPWTWLLMRPAVLVTGALRRHGTPVPEFVQVYEQAVEAIRHGMRYGGPTLAAVRGPSGPLSWRWFVLPTVVALVLWFTEPLLPVSGLRIRAVEVKCGVLRTQTVLSGADGWSGPNAVCPVKPAAASGEAPAGSPVGGLNILTYNRRQVVAAGWAFDPSAPDDPVEVRVHVDSSAAGGVTVRALTGAPRPDVVAARGFGARSGFGAFIDTDAGAHDVCVFAMNRGEGVNVLLGCKDIPASR